MWDVAFGPDGTRLAACGNKGVRIWGVANREVQATWPSQSWFIECLAFSPDGKRLATGGAEGIVELWDTATGQKVQTFRGHLGSVETLAFGPDGTRLATGGADGTLRLWDTTARRDAISITKDGLSATEIPALSPDGQTLLTGFYFGQAKAPPALGHRDGRTALRPDRAPAADALISAWTADSKRLYIATRGRPSTSWMSRPARSSVRSRSTPCPRTRQYMRTAISLCESGRRSPDGTIRLRDTRTGALSRTIGRLDGEARLGLGVQSGRLAAARS